MVYSRIIGTGSYIPDYMTLRNENLEAMLKESFPDDPEKWTSDEWIIKRTGIKERRISGPKETNASMGTEALRKALENSDISPDKLDMIIVATNTNEKNFPACGGEIQHELGAKCGFFDVQAGCTGFIYGLSIGDAFIKSEQYDTVAIVGTDKLSAITDYKDRETCVLFGDMASSFILQKSNDPGIIKNVLKGKGLGRDNIGLTSPDIDRLKERVKNIQTGPIYTTGQGYLFMNGREVFKFATNALPEVCLDVIKDTGYTIKDVKKIFPHNANLRIIESAANKLARKIDVDNEIMQGRFYHNIDKYGNASAASNANSFNEALTSGIIKKGDLVILAGFGAGLTYGASALIV